MIQKIMLVLSFVICGSLYSFNHQYSKSATTKKKMKILMVMDKFPSAIKTIILHQITGLIDRGHEVHIYTYSLLSIKDCHPDVYSYKLLGVTFTNMSQVDLSSYDIIWAQYGTVAKEIVELHKKHKLKAKLVTSFRGEDVTAHEKAIPYNYISLFTEGDLFLPVCEYYRYRLMLLGCSLEKMQVVHSAIDCKKFTYKEISRKKNDPVHVVSVARLMDKKGIEYAIAAVTGLVQKYKNITYTIVGDGKDKDKIIQLIKDLNMVNHIFVVGHLSQNQVIKILKTAHLFILPSVTSITGNQEGIPNAIKEAMAMGIPVISTYHAGILELVENGVSGYLVPERAVSELIKKMSYLIDHPEICLGMGKAGRKKIEDMYEVDKVNDSIEELLFTLLGNNKIVSVCSTDMIQKKSLPAAVGGVDLSAAWYVCGHIESILNNKHFDISDKEFFVLQTYYNRLKHADFQKIDVHCNSYKKFISLLDYFIQQRAVGQKSTNG